MAATGSSPSVETSSASATPVAIVHKRSSSAFRNKCLRWWWTEKPRERGRLVLGRGEVSPSFIVEKERGKLIGAHGSKRWRQSKNQGLPILAESCDDAAVDLSRALWLAELGKAIGDPFNSMDEVNHGQSVFSQVSPFLLKKILLGCRLRIKHGSEKVPERYLWLLLVLELSCVLRHGRAVRRSPTVGS